MAILETVGVPLATATISAVSRGGPRRQFKWNKRLAEHQNAMNRANAEWTLEQQRRIQEEQRAYDSPEAQMQRFIEAGLNPHMIYGGGSGSAGQAFPMNAPSLPGAQMGQVDASYPDVAGDFIRASQAMSSMQLNQARTELVQMQEQVAEVQKEIAQSNPMLNPNVAKAVSEMMLSNAQAKMNENRELWMQREETSEMVWRKYTLGADKIRSEVESAMQKLGLNTADLAIKNKILESKEFENVVKELNAKWLKDADITPEHFRQGLMLILQRFMR